MSPTIFKTSAMASSITLKILFIGISQFTGGFSYQRLQNCEQAFILYIFFYLIKIQLKLLLSELC